MKLAKAVYLKRQGSFVNSREWTSAYEDLQKAIKAIVWPKGSKSFLLNPSKGRGRGEGNGVVPIKEACMLTLRRKGWSTDERRNPFRLDATKATADGRLIGVEWETGNISSSHRAINRLLVGYMQQKLIAGVLIVPTRNLYGYLTDRVGNLQELEPYFPIWRRASGWSDGVLAIIAVEHNGTSPGVPRIKKGTDGRALV